MNKMIRRASIALASTTMVAGAALGAGSAASAATAAPVEQAQSPVTAVDAGHARDGYHPERHEGRNRSGYTDDHKDLRHSHHSARHGRGNVHHAHGGDDHRWVAVSSSHGVTAERWHQDQLDLFNL
ncbi:hypothetical protein ACUJ8H_45305 [Streptomyces sp. EKR5.2]|uniref:hypothetical protein n=1 Tax=Streptomyces sp. EKR5.2 TaxID=3461014 RepID=UPI004041CCCC